MQILGKFYSEMNVTMYYFRLCRALLVNGCLVDSEQICGKSSVNPEHLNITFHTLPNLLSIRTSMKRFKTFWINSFEWDAIKHFIKINLSYSGCYMVLEVYRLLDSKMYEQKAMNNKLYFKSLEIFRNFHHNIIRILLCLFHPKIVEQR